MTLLITAEGFAELRRARDDGVESLQCSLDLRRSTLRVELRRDHWQAQGENYPYWDGARERTVYFWQDGRFQPAARFSGALIKLVPTSWGPPTFEIDGIKMLPSAALSPYLDAQNKVSLIEPKNKAVLDCCGGLGYFAAHALAQGAKSVTSFEKNAGVVWLRSLNSWSPQNDVRLRLYPSDIARDIAGLPSAAFDAVLHDPPRISIAGDLYSGRFYEQLARVIRPRGLLFHYTGAPQRASHGRDLADEVLRRLRQYGFKAAKALDGVLASRVKDR